MRNELAVMDKIEQYLNGTLSTTEEALFKAEIDANPELAKQVNIQQDLVESFERIGLRLATRSAYRTYFIKKVLMISGIIFTAIAFLTFTTIYLSTENQIAETVEEIEMDNEDPGIKEVLPETGKNRIHEIAYVDIEESDSLIQTKDTVYTELDTNYNADFRIFKLPQSKPNRILLKEDDPLFTTANTLLNQELFELDTQHDTVIESENGIVIYIPANAFDTKFSNVDFIVQEALTPEDIMFSGLNTMTKDGDTLETGGMFYVDAFANGKRVQLIKNLTVDIPGNPEKTGMQLYEGEKTANGELVWKNPKKLERPLIPSEITQLDFYPPGYEKQMNSWGYFNKEFIDSLYYSFETNNQFRYQLVRSNRAVIMEGKRQKNEKYGLIMSQNGNELYFKSTKTKKRYQVDGLSMNTQAQNELVYDSTTQSYRYPTTEWGSIPAMTVDSEELFWTVSVEEVGERLVDVIFELNLTNGTYIYSTRNVSRYNMPTQFLFRPNLGTYQLVGSVEETGNFIIEREPNYNIMMEDRSNFSHSPNVQFKQRIKLFQDTTIISVNKAYMYCLNGTETIGPQEDSMTIQIYFGERDYGVNPAAVHTIWNAKFNNTNLATKEFEERMPWIHRTCNTGILELYVKNLDKTLMELDRDVAAELSGELKQKFLEFAALEQGKVEINNAAQKELNAYYSMKYQAFKEITKATNKAYWDKQKKMDQQFNQERLQAEQAGKNRQAFLDRAEFEYNTEKVYERLGMKKPDPRANPLVQLANQTVNQRVIGTNTPANPNRSILRATISRTGWNNVDCLMSVSMARESVKIKGNGKTTSITYKPLNLNVENRERYSQIHLYIVPKAFNSFVKISPRNNNYKYSLNNDLAYRTVAIGWIGDEMYAYQDEETAPGTRTIVLEKMDKAKWELMIQNTFPSINGMKEEIDYIRFLQSDKERQNINKAKQNLKAQAEPFVFPCSQISQGTNEISDTEATKENSPD